MYRTSLSGPNFAAVVREQSNDRIEKRWTKWFALLLPFLPPSPALSVAADEQMFVQRPEIAILFNGNQRVPPDVPDEILHGFILVSLLRSAEVRVEKIVGFQVGKVLVLYPVRPRQNPSRVGFRFSYQHSPGKPPK